ncbi:hypothetical protein NEIFLAOT_02236 [Neisseria flavescens NRL30031/H210]|uniref:Uncharacterized protein n=1 Tax=Neisseria flavescens NRL30031/H210 TaxID=546264 RepID=C0EQI1_NEIFL|nr:hypothetical protein NEIFLAOT_02236 [Neisseria flavescens NRL30031/H210]
MYILNFFFDEIKIMRYMVNVTTEALASRLQYFKSKINAA